MMKLCVLTIKPKSGFGTPLKGDTLFGHFCWQVSHDSSLLDGGLEKWIAGYFDTPYAVFSSAYPKLVKGEIQYVLKRPDLPIPLWPREKAPADRKEFKRKKRMLVKEDLAIDLNSIDILADEEMEIRAWETATEETKKIMKMNQDRRFTLNTEQPHNTINRLSGTTGEGMFAPYSENVGYFYPDSEMAVFILFDEKATDLDRISRGMEMIGRWGYGKDASIGQGKFSLGKCEEIAWPQTESANACYTLGPLVPEKDAYQEYFFTPFIRFGKHGDLLARSAIPFKNPVIMADEGAVFIPRNRDAFEKHYIGRGLTGLSKAMPESVGQGYSIYLPFRMEIRHE